MSTQAKTGGPAHPIQGGWGLDSTGMTLRDYFAAASLPSVIQHWANVAHDDGESFFLSDVGIKAGDKPFATEDAMMIATEAYALADAMLEARK